MSKPKSLGVSCSQCGNPFHGFTACPPAIVSPRVKADKALDLRALADQIRDLNVFGDEDVEAFMMQASKLVDLAAKKFEDDIAREVPFQR